MPLVDRGFFYLVLVHWIEGKSIPVKKIGGIWEVDEGSH